MLLNLSLILFGLILLWILLLALDIILISQIILAIKNYWTLSLINNLWILKYLEAYILTNRLLARTTELLDELLGIIQVLVGDIDIST